ncbi:hypothetical protein SD939_10565, partial [Lactobacillus crispatus]|uniref:hypothetical protein n=1 Tax=Lactobacillus crispatus TaxID=47770 RepID=UPI0029C27E5F
LLNHRDNKSIHQTCVLVFEGAVMDDQEKKNELLWKVAKLMKEREEDPAAKEMVEKIKALLPSS